jgi:hypothetical protein
MDSFAHTLSLMCRIMILAYFELSMQPFIPQCTDENCFCFSLKKFKSRKIFLARWIVMVFNYR